MRLGRRKVHKASDSAAQKAAYHERTRVQCLTWAQGRPYHNSVDNECCPDFSCCYPNMFETDEAERWRQYKKKYGSAS